jgi:hypothetical protein
MSLISGIGGSIVAGILLNWLTSPANRKATTIAEKKALVYGRPDWNQGSAGPQNPAKVSGAWVLK